MRQGAVSKLRDVLRRFARNESGNTAVIFGIALIPLIGLTGAAVDYGRAANIRTAMQVAVDSTALALSKEAATDSASQLQNSATAYFNALFTRKDAQNVQLTATYTTSPNTQVVIGATATMKTDFMGVMGITQLPLGVSSTTVWGNSRLRVALVLDNTGSMSQHGKLTALQTAAKNLLDQLKAAATSNGDVYVSIIPFTTDVNVGATNYTQSWIGWSGSTDTWDENNGTCSKSSYHKKSSCLSHGGTWTPDNHDTWDGCIMDRDQNYDTTATTPIANDPNTPSTLFPADPHGSCPVQLMPLSYDWTALKSKINSMSANGTTNQAIGLAWGWLSLLQSAPLNAPAEDSKYKYQKVIIMLTDGLNTQDRWYSNASQIDARQKIACDNIKAAGITIYAVQVNTDGAPTSTLLQYCATDASKFFLLTSANEIITTFAQIGTVLSQLRVAK